METYRDLLSQIHTNCKNIPFHKKLSAYNIFDVLEIQSREVIMCRFLTNLLNPEEMHGCGIRFLKSFIRDVLKMDPVSDTLLLHTEVVKEYPIDKECGVSDSDRGKNLCGGTGRTVFGLL